MDKLKRSALRCAVTAGVMLALTGAMGARATDTGLAMPGLLSMADKHGVDQASGLYILPRLNVAIGSTDSGLSLSPTIFDDQFSGWVESEVDDAPFMFTQLSLGGDTYRFAIGDYSQTTTTFTRTTSGTPYQPLQGESVVSTYINYAFAGYVCSSMQLYDTQTQHYVLNRMCGSASKQYYYEIYNIYYVSTVAATSTTSSPYAAGTFLQKGNAGSAATLSLSNNVYTLTLSDGTQCIYTNSLLSKIIKNTGETIYIDYYYNAAGNVLLEENRRATDSVSWKTSIGTSSSTTINYFQRPVKKAVYSSAGWAMRFDIDTSNGNKTTKATAFNRSVTNCQESSASCTQYGAEAQVSRLATTSGVTTFYSNEVPQISYSGSASQTVLTTPKGVSKTVNMKTVTWDGQAVPGQVTSIIHGGQTWNYAFSTSVNYLTTVQNPDLTSFTNFHDFKSPLYITDELGRKTQYKYYDASTGFRRSDVLPPESVDAGTNASGEYYGATHYTYDARGNVTEIRNVAKNGSTLADIVRTFSYDSTCSEPKTCNQPNSVTDANGKTTNFTYDSATGLITTQTGPADSNGVRPQTRYTYTAMYAKVLNSSSVLVNAEGPIYKITRVSQCVVATSTNPASCVGTADEKVTAYEYNSNNLLLTAETTMAGNANTSQAASGTNLWARTSYGYDDIGNRVWADGPRTDVDDRAYTTYDALRRPVFGIGIDPDGSGSLKRVVVKHTYDADGNETLTQTGTGSVTVDSNGLPTGVPDFSVVSFKRNTYDATTGLLTKTEVGQP